jgi:tRNA threonylcarbamoyladenosine biosynthesis protein TsaE
MATHISRSPAETLALGQSWGREANPGWVIALHGDLGAGKTQLVKGLAQGLGISARVYSPTFALVNLYQGGRLVLSHLDLYRLDTPSQVLSAGLEDYFAPSGVTVVEWAERWFGPKPQTPSPSAGPLPQFLRWVEMQVRGENERLISYEDFSH